MFFAVASPPAEARQLCIDWLHETRSHADLNAYLLIDLAFDSTALDTPTWRRLPHHSLYANTALTGLAHMGPWLVTLPDDASARTRHIEMLMARADNKPMWSLLLSAAPVEELGAQLSPCLQAETSDGLRWPVRWGDTRILPNLLAALSADETCSWLAQVHTWAWFDRWGQWVTRQPGMTHRLATPKQLTNHLWQLDEARFANLVECGEVDQILSQIDDHRPHLLKPWAPTQAYDRVASALAVGHQHRLDAAPDCLALATLALSLDARFLTHPSFTQALQAARQGRPFKGCLENLDASFWDECALTPETV